MCVACFSYYAKMLAKRLILKKKNFRGKRIRLFRVEKSHPKVGCVAKNTPCLSVAILGDYY